MLDELPAGEIVLAFPIDVGRVDAVLDQKFCAATAERIHHRLGAATVAVRLELRPRPVEISRMKEMREPDAHLLVRGLTELGQMRRAQEAMLSDKPDKQDVTVGQLKAAPASHARSAACVA